jgi:uracil-DNA glycosylase family 4
VSLNNGVRRHLLARCEDCSLNDNQSVFVPSTQPSSGRVKLVICGEAPGVQEARTGKSFTGPSGKLLDAVLKGNGLRREDCFVTNACLCRPRDNATPTPSNVTACSVRLQDELTTATATGAPIIALGNVAASAIFGFKVAITAFRVGPPKESPLYPGIKVVPTVHPAYVLRQADAYPTFAGDIGKVNANVNVRWEPPVFRIFDEEVSASRALRELRERAGDVVVDIEAGAEKDIKFIHPDQYKLLCVGLCYAPGRAIVIGETALRSGRADGQSEVRHMLASVLENRRARIVAHNGKFDLAGLRHIAPKAVLGFDTMLASYAVDERAGVHGLKYLAVETLGAPQYDLEIHKYLGKDKNFSDIPRDILYKYNAMDVACTYDLKTYYEARMTEDEKQVHNMLCRASDMLMRAEMRGLRIDVPYLRQLADQFSGELIDMEDVLGKWVANPRSPQQVKAALLAQGVRTESTDVEHLTEILRRVGKGTETRAFVEQLMLHRKSAKLYGTYIKGILRRLYKGRVHPTFMLHGTTTGRLACRNPNLQNQPRDPRMRRMYIPSEGKTFVQGDYKGAELRVLACEAKDEYLRQLFADGRDIHNEVAERFFGPHFTKDQRVRAKAVVFGLAYGREAASLAGEFQIPMQEAQGYLDAFFSMIPQVVEWQAGIKDAVLHGSDDLRTHFGRHRRVWLVTDANAKDVVKESYAFKPQSIASDITLNAAMVLHEKYHMDIRLLVHDSILVETTQPKAVAAIMREEMPKVAAEVYSDYVPFEADVKVGDSWAEV